MTDGQVQMLVCFICFVFGILFDEFVRHVYKLMNWSE
jgi:hypothetical protein